MAVALLRGENFRLYRSLDIQPEPGLNVITGDNAAGKTSLLEALFVAARGRSFRAQNLSELCGPFQPSWSVFAQTAEAPESHKVGFGWTREGADLRFDDDRNARISDVVKAIPIQLIDPTAHRLLDDGPSYRRSFVDWGVFHVEHRFLDCWRRYQRALKQRNSALRDQLPDRAVLAWTDELVATGEALTEMRKLHVESAATGLAKWAGRLLGTEDVRCEWQRGWPESETLRQVFESNLEQHRRLANTVQGPHRAELKIRLKQVKAKGHISRGQQKMLVAAMVLSQCELLIAAGTPVPILLLDDFGSELSPEYQGRLADALAAYAGQKFVTAFEKPSFESTSKARMFHVEHGTIRSLNSLH